MRHVPYALPCSFLGFILLMLFLATGFETGSWLLDDAVTTCFLVEGGPKLRVPFLLPVVVVAAGDGLVGLDVLLILLLEVVVGLVDVLDVKDLVLDMGVLFFSPSTVRFVGEMSRKTTFEFLRMPHFTLSSIAS